MWKPTNFLDAMLPLFLIHLIFCHGIIQYPRLSKTKIYHSLLYSITTITIFCTCLVYVYIRWSDRIFLNNPKTSYYINTAVMTFTMVINTIISWIYKNKSLAINSRLVRADETLNKLGIPINTQKELVIIFISVIFWMLFASFLDVSHILATERNLDVSEKIMPTLVLQHAQHVNVLIDMIFCSLIKHMRIRFKSMNQVLLDIFKLQDNNSKHKKKTDYKWAISRRINFEKDFVKILHDVRSLHIELGILCRELTKIYAIPIIFSILTAYVNITTVLVIIYRIIVQPQTGNFDKVVVIVSLFLWIAIFSLRLFVINYFCAESICEWKKAGEIVHKLEFESNDDLFQKEIKLFSIQILQNPLVFSPCGLFDLGYYLIRDLAGAITAQVILSIQTYRFTSK